MRYLMSKYASISSRLRLLNPQGLVNVIIAKTSFLFLLTALLLFNTCERSGAAEDDFDAFYQKFHADSAYQMQHIQFPLPGVSAMSDEDPATFRWEADAWQPHRLLDPQTTGFESEFVHLGDDLVIEKIINRKQGIAMERRFSKLGGNQWLLIFYADAHRLDTVG